MSATEYDRLTELGATWIPGMFPGSGIHILTSPVDGSASLWVTEPTKPTPGNPLPDTCRAVLLPPGGVEAVIAALTAGLTDARGAGDG